MFGFGFGIGTDVDTEYRYRIPNPILITSTEYRISKLNPLAKPNIRYQVPDTEAETETDTGYPGSVSVLGIRPKRKWKYNSEFLDKGILQIRASNMCMCE